MSERRAAFIKRMGDVYQLTEEQAVAATYIIVTTRRGSNMLYWRDNGCGYSASLQEAGLFTFDKAVAAAAGPRDSRGDTCDLAAPLSHYIEELEEMKRNVDRLLEAAHR